jgi:hypothetical protein
MRVAALALVATIGMLGCTLPPNVIQPNCKMTIGGVEPSAQGWVYCATDTTDDNLLQFTVRDGTGNALVVIAPGTGTFVCGKPNLEVELQFNGALAIAGCDPAASCMTTTGSCNATLTKFSAGGTQSFAGTLDADVTGKVGAPAYHIDVSGSFSD